MKSHIIPVYLHQLNKRSSVSVDPYLWGLFLASKGFDESEANKEIRDHCRQVCNVKSEYVRRYILLKIAKPSLVKKAFGSQDQLKLEL